MKRIVIAKAERTGEVEIEPVSIVITGGQDKDKNAQLIGRRLGMRKREVRELP